MARFRFNLEPVLNYRQQLEELAKEELAGSLAIYQQKRSSLEMMEKELSATCLPNETGKLDLEKLLHQEHYQYFLGQLIEEQTVLVVQAEETVETCRQQVVEKMQGRKVVETLKEKRWKEFHYQQEQEEQKRIDDLATAQYTRKSIDK